MTAVPARLQYLATVQDAHGDVAHVSFPAHVADASISTTKISDLYTNVGLVTAALAAAMTGKLIELGVVLHWSRAQKPAGPLGTYAHVYQQALLNFGDGGTERTKITIPTPLTTDFLADGITVNPADANVAALIAQIEALCIAQSGSAFNEYLGGRFRQGHPRRRTNLYNATA
jgi:hypothetical protein